MAADCRRVADVVDRLLTYVGVCCREWEMAVGFPPGRCGLCGKRPTRKETDGQPIPAPAEGGTGAR